MINISIVSYSISSLKRRKKSDWARSCFVYYRYHSSPTEFTGFRIVGFEIEPHSLANQGTECADGANAPVLDLDANSAVTFTYDVLWKFSEDTWSGRWERYMRGAKGKIHWFSILNSLMIVLFLSSMVAMILLRTLHRDIARYNEIATSEDSAEETGAISVFIK